MTRGDIAVVAQRGLYEGKPARLSSFSSTRSSTIIRPSSSAKISSDPRSNTGAFYRDPVTPNASNGLRGPSIIMIDRIVKISRDDVRDVIGTLDPTSRAALDRALALFPGLI